MTDTPPAPEPDDEPVGHPPIDVDAAAEEYRARGDEVTPWISDEGPD